MNTLWFSTKKIRLVLTTFAMLSFFGGQLAHGEPRPILTSWEDIETYDINAPDILTDVDAPKGGVLRLTTTGSYDNFHVFAQRGKATHYFMYTYEALAQSLPNEPNAVRGLLADSFDLSEDRTKLVVTINPLARFSDGSKVTAADVVFTYEALQRDANPLYKIGFQDVLTVTAESESTVVYTFKENASRELPLDVCLLPVFSAKWWEGRNFADPQHEAILASGPFQVKNAEFGVRFSLKRNPDYWAKDLPRNRGKYNFDEVIIDYYQDATVAREAFFAGQADYYYESNINNWQNAYDVEPVRNGSIVKKVSERGTTIGVMGVTLNTRNPILADKRVRHALMVLMDFEWVNKSMYYGSYNRIYSYFTGHRFKIDSKPNAEELAVLHEYKDLLDPAVFDDLPKIPVTRGDGTNREQMKEALEILKTAGWTLQNGKMVDKNGKQMKLKFIVNSQIVQRTYNYYVQNLARVGIDLQLQLLDQNQYSAELKPFNFDMCYTFIPINHNPTSELRYYWDSKIANVEGSKNYSGITDPVVDDLIERMVASKTQKELELYTRVLDRVLQHGIYMIPTWYTTQIRTAWWKDRITPGNIDAMGMLSAPIYWYDASLKAK